MTDYKHKTLRIKCCIQSNKIKNNEINIRLPSTSNWDKNLKTILSKINKKFEFIKNMNNSQWILTINEKIIDKNDSVKFGKLLSSIPPVAIIKIIQSVIILYYFMYTKKMN